MRQFKVKKRVFILYFVNTAPCQDFPCSSVVKNPPAGAGNTRNEDPLEEEMATHSSILAWKIPWTEEPGGLQSMGLQRADMTERLIF